MRPFPNSPAPGSPITSGPPRGTWIPQRVMSPSTGPPRGMSAQTGPSRAGANIPPPRPTSAGRYAPPSHNSSGYGPPPPQSGGYAPPPPGVNPVSPTTATGRRTWYKLDSAKWPPAPPPGGGAPRAGTPTAPAAKVAPKAPKYPPGDREHIPDSDKVLFQVLSEHLGRLRQNTPPQQKRMVDDIERRLNVLFDPLNCETLSSPVIEQLITLTQSMQSGNAQKATSIHVDLLTRGSRTDDIGLWMSGVKQLIIRM
ncbi:unnamed protein product [Rhizoctonia solani]|uniref:SRA1/Sec31 domain-containing protein n=1 Tax=Rhizoctonia solani TaxID=456999 RepID=A0A8H2W6K4_9AGAM|nr:unnamed protein product [Rhizoctonia solani]